MSPDIEWRVGDDSDQQTIIKSPPKKPAPRWHKTVVVLMITLGAGLGVVYSSMPESQPLPRSTVVPTPLPPPPTRTPTPRPLGADETINREVQALAQGDVQAFMALQDVEDTGWYNSQLSAFQKWGTPASGGLYEIYAIGELMTSLSDQPGMVVDICQFRTGRDFRETRFYRLKNNRWVRTRPDLSFWGEAETGHKEHFDMVFRYGDAALAYLIADQFEQAYSRLCTDLDCPTTQHGSLPRVVTMTLAFDPALSQFAPPAVEWSASLTFTFPSPHVMGVYYQQCFDPVLAPDETIDQAAYENLPYFIARIASGGPDRWNRSMKGDLLAGIIGHWERTRIRPIPELPDSRILAPLRTVKELPPLEKLWDATPPYSSLQSQIDVMVAETWSVIRFIETRFGPGRVAKFLNAIGAAKSLPDAIEHGLGIRYADFEQEWQTWLEQQGITAGH